MDNFFTSFTRLSRSIREKLTSDDRWSDIFNGLDEKLKQVRDDFFRQCISALENSKYENAIVNRSIKSSIDIIIISFQFIYIMDYVKHHIEKKNIHAFAEKLLHVCCRKHHKRCIDIINCYSGLKNGKTEKLLYYFSIDISKYICGYETHDIPSKFPCLNSYISSGIPQEILPRTHVTGSSFIIQTQAVDLKNETVQLFQTSFKTAEKDDGKSHDAIQLSFLKYNEQ